MKLEIELSDAQLDELADRVAARTKSAPVASGNPWTADELAKATRQHPATIRRAVNAGRIKRVPATSKMLIPAAEAQRIIEGRES